MNNYLDRYNFQRPSFWEGVARIFDLGGTLNYHEFPQTPEEIDEYDRKAIKSDWDAIGDDFRSILGDW